MRLIILGGPGAGKGTQAEQLCHRLKIPLISTGNMLREAIATQTELGRQARVYLEKGELVPDELMIAFIRDRLLIPDTQSGWLLEGYPRTAFQAEELDFLLDEFQQRLDWAIWLNVSPEVMRSRSLLRSRPDDSPATIERRIQLFGDRTIPILDYYAFRRRLIRINGDLSIETVQQEIGEKLNLG